jgi:NitT/TauT family transport system substrate-binding protein
VLASLGALLGGTRAHAEPGPAPLRLAVPHGIVADVAVPAALKLGLFAQYGLEINLIDAARDSSDIPAMLASRKIDAAVAPVLLLLPPLNTGLDARLVTGISGGGLRLLATKRSGLRHIEDVKHKRIGIAYPNGSAKLFFSVMMRRKGINPFAEVQWLTVDEPAQEAALRSGQVDIIAAADPQAFLLLRALDATEIASNRSGSYRERVANVLACTGPLLRDRRPAASLLARSLRQAAAWAAAHPTDAATLIASWSPALSPDDRTAMLRTETLSETPAGADLVDDVAEYADELRLLGTFPYQLNAERFARSVCDNVLAGKG